MTTLSTHAFFDHNHECRTPVLAVTSYSLIDAFAPATSWSALQKDMTSLTETLRARNDEIKDHILVGVLLKQAAECFTDDNADMLLDLDMQNIYRPLHYATDPKRQTVEWVKARQPNRDIVGECYAMLCDKVDRRRKGIVYHDSACDAADAALLEHEQQGVEFPVTGFLKTYMRYFGGNESFMRRYTGIEEVFSDEQMDRLEDASERFMSVRRQSHLDALKREILIRAQIDRYGVTDLKDKQTGELLATVPTLPLMCWAFKRNVGDGTSVPDYEPVCYSGFKVNMDCPYHSDWMVGGDLDLDLSYRDAHPIQKSAVEWAWTWQKKHLGVEHHVLSSGAPVCGPIRHATPNNAQEIQPGDIVVLPNGNIQYQEHINRACRNGTGGFITEIGSQAAHLTKVSRERNVPVLRIENARQIFPEGLTVTLDTRRGQIDIADSDDNNAKEAS